MTQVIGREGISAKIIAHSVSESNQEIITYELEYPRFILSELNTHRMLSKNSASSRAIPVAKMIALIDERPAMPVHWGKNQSGMQANEELSGVILEGAKQSWVAASKAALSATHVLNDIGLHKQITNRICEPWSRMKTVVTGTEWSNFFVLRAHKDAQPEIHELADTMLDAYKLSVPKLLKSGEWHLPYVNDSSLSLEDAKTVSVSCCAQVSYRNTDDSLDKAKQLVARLTGGELANNSPF